MRSWGLSVTVLNPPTLAEQVAAEARRVTARYDAAPDDDATPDTTRPDA